MIKKNKIQRILIAPLDWGLGHATRCIPLINSLKSFGYEVIIACNPVQKKLLQQEFPALDFLIISGYNIQYSRTKRGLVFKILMQLPKILLTIQKEHRWLQKAIQTHSIDLVISDNRFGLFTKLVPCIFITHQLTIQAPNKWLKRMMQFINYYFIQHFHQCWVPDLEGNLNIAGILSHPNKLPRIPVKYMGPLSRFEKIQNLDKKFEWMIILSGPEPQRSILEKKFLKIVDKLGKNVLLVRGKPGCEESIEAPANCTVKNHLSTSMLQAAFGSSEYIISRSGYTTVMEILFLQKKSILIPTPGQTEQEYLADHLMNQNWCYSFNQEEKDYLYHINAAKNFIYKLPGLEPGSLEKICVELEQDFG